MIVPQYLKQGSKIGITCPSGYTSTDRITYCIHVLKKWGFEVKLGNTIGTGNCYFSGSDDERKSDLQAMLDDTELDAILMGRGGYGMSRIIDSLDFTQFIKKPKWICGFSDITVIHNHIQNNFGIQTLHSPMCGHFKPETENADFLISFFDALTGGDLLYSSPPFELNRKGEFTGILTGGNLALIAHLIGSKSEVDTAGKILFIEDVGEYLYNIDRMMMQLKRAQKFDKVGGVVFGGFTDTKDTERPYGQNVEELLYDNIKEFNFPVAFHFPCGHQDENFTLTLGAIHKMEVNDMGLRLSVVR